MKNIHPLLIAAVFLTASTFTIKLAAHDTPLPPRLKAVQQERATVAGAATDTLDRAVKTISPRGLQSCRELARVASAQPDTDLVLANRSSLPPKLYELRRERSARFELAPLK